MVENLKDKINYDVENIKETITELNKALSCPTFGNIELAAISTYIHNIYKGMENILTLILKHKNVVIVKNDSWHKSIVNEALEIGIISNELSLELKKYLSFRHYFIHGYSVKLRQEDLLPLAKNIESVWNNFKQTIVSAAILHPSTTI
ncbi:MAG: hypothetical protein QME49_09290 [bacterium]|nr:hypothetical protein [bacterium]